MRSAQTRLCSTIIQHVVECANCFDCFEKFIVHLGLVPRARCVCCQEAFGGVVTVQLSWMRICSTGWSSSWSGVAPSVSRVCPWREQPQFSGDLEKCHFGWWHVQENWFSSCWIHTCQCWGLRVRPAAWIFVKAAFKRLSCSCWVWTKMSTSSMWHSAPSWPARIWFILRWKCSGALLIPKSSLLKAYLPSGVMNVVRLCDSSDSGICQKPQLVSNLLKIVAPASWACVTSTFGKGWTSRSTLSFICR